MNKNKNPNPGRVLQLITGLGVGGAERVVLELADRLVKQGCPVIVVALDGNGSLLKQYKNADFHVHLLDINKKNPFSILRALFALISLVRREKVTVIHAHMFHALLAGLVCRLARPKIKLVFTSHNFAGFSSMRRLLITKTKLLRAVDIVFVKDQHEAMNAADTVVRPNGVAINLNEKPRQLTTKEKRVFLFVGRLEMQKNPLALIEAFFAMKHKGCDLWLAGDGILRKEVEQLVASLGLGGRVKMLGIQNDIPSLLRQVDCFVMSSSWEGLPMALLEAGAAALPVIATPVGAIPDVLGKDCGYLTKIENLAEALDVVIDDYAMAKIRGLRLQERIAAVYNLDQTSTQHKKLYAQLSACAKKRIDWRI
jgi:glycosyltransferase involved in cell wall biosynthesis